MRIPSDEILRCDHKWVVRPPPVLFMLKTHLFLNLAMNHFDVIIFILADNSKAKVRLHKLKVLLTIQIFKLMFFSVRLFFTYWTKIYYWPWVYVRKHRILNIQNNEEEKTPNRTNFNKRHKNTCTNFLTHPFPKLNKTNETVYQKCHFDSFRM